MKLLQVEDIPDVIEQSEQHVIKWKHFPIHDKWLPKSMAAFAQLVREVNK